MATSIVDWNDLDNIRNDLSDDYVLENDLDSSTDGYDSVASDSANDGQGFLPLGDFNETSFTGTFDGQGNTIADVYSKPDDRNDGGVFGFGEDVTISNLNVVNADIEVDGRAGVLGGSFVENSLIENIFTSGIVVVDTDTSGFTDTEFAGGVCAGGGLTAENCYSIASVEAISADGQGIGSAFGAVEEAEIIHCYGTGELTSPDDDFVGGFLGFDSGGDSTIQECYWDTESTGYSTSDGGTGLTTAEMQGDSASDNLVGFDFNSVWLEVIEGESIGGFPVNADGYPILSGNDGLAQMQEQDVVASGTFIEDWNDLDDMRDSLQDDYVLLNDLDRNTDGYDGIGDDWTPIVNFGGSLDGQGNTIYDLKIDIRDRSEDTPCGLFETWNNNEPVTVKNLSILNADVKSATGESSFASVPEAGTAILVGAPWSDSIPRSIDRTITNCTFTGNVEANSIIGSVAGGMTSDNSTVSNVYADITANINPPDTSGVIGGIVGAFQANQITNCIVNLEVQRGRRVGGIVGGFSPDNPIENSIAKVDINIDDSDNPGNIEVGGLVGDVSAGFSLNNCYALGNIAVTGDEGVGGLIGVADAPAGDMSIENSYSAVSLKESLDSTNIGGVIGNIQDGTFTATDVYWDQERAGTTNDAATNTVPLKTSEMQGSSASTNMNFDFDLTWSVLVDPIEGYPYVIASVDGSEHPFIDRQLTFQNALDGWTLNTIRLGETVDEVRTWDNLELVLRYSGDEVRSLVRSLKSNSEKVDVVEVDSGGFRSIDLSSGDNTFNISSPADRFKVRSVDEWLVGGYDDSLLDKSGNVYELELDLVPIMEKSFDNGFGTFDGPPSPSRDSGEWLFDFEFGAVATRRVGVDVTEESDSSVGVFVLETVMRPEEVRVVEENLGFLNNSVVRNVPDAEDVVEDTSFDGRNTVDITVPDGFADPLSSGEYIVRSFETEWISGAFRVTLEVAQ